jgi:uncharacterized membrane protein
MTNQLALVVVVLLAIGYVAAGVVTAYVYDTITDGGVNGAREALRVVAGWPVIAWTALASLYALWATKRELDNLGGEP